MYRYHLLILFLSYNYYLLINNMFSKIIPSFFVDKASCTRQFESDLSLYSLALLFPIKEGSTFLTKPLFNSLYAPFGSPSSGGQKPSGTRGCNRPNRCSEPLRSKVGGASKPSTGCAGWDRLDLEGIIWCKLHLVFIR